MRKLFAFIMLAIFVSFSFEGFTQTGPWSWSHPTPQGNTLRWVKYWDANNWYAVGYAGTFMKTTNAGSSWTWTHTANGLYGTSGQHTNIYSAYFFNQSTGLTFGVGNSASGSNGIWRTTNGGINWDTTNMTPYISGTFYNASFVNNNLGYACATTAPYVFRTENGGMTWTGVTTAGGSAYDIHAFDSLNIIVASSSGNVRRTTNGGANWAAVSTGASVTLYRIVFQDANTGYVSGSSSAFRVTTDGGLTWTIPANSGLITGWFSGQTNKDSLPHPQLSDAGVGTILFDPTNSGTGRTILNIKDKANVLISGRYADLPDLTTMAWLPCKATVGRFSGHVPERDGPVWTAEMKRPALRRRPPVKCDCLID